VVVAELAPGVVQWHRGPLGMYAGNPLADPRTTVKEGDVAKLLRSEKKTPTPSCSMSTMARKGKPARKTTGSTRSTA
jgi:hypothetical protein